MFRMPVKIRFLPYPVRNLIAVIWSEQSQTTTNQTFGLKRLLDAISKGI